MCNHFQGKHVPPQQAHAGQQLLSLEAESVLVDWIAFLSDTGHPLSKWAIWKKAEALCGKKPSQSWIRYFLRHHLEIKLGKPSGLDPKHAQAIEMGARHDVDGTAGSAAYANPEFTGPAGIAAMVSSSNQAFLGQAWSRTYSQVQQSASSPNYFGASVGLISMLVMSGNFRSRSRRIMTAPTAPLAPTTATRFTALSLALRSRRISTGPSYDRSQMAAKTTGHTDSRQGSPNGPTGQN